MLSSIPAIGSHVALKFIKDKVVAGELTAAEAAQAIMSATHLVAADPESVKLLEASWRLKGLFFYLNWYGDNSIHMKFYV